MAPTRTRTRTSKPPPPRRLNTSTTTASSSHTRNTSSTSAPEPTHAFNPTKRDKRQIKHSLLVSKSRASAARDSANGRIQKRSGTRRSRPLSSSSSATRPSESRNRSGSSDGVGMKSRSRRNRQLKGGDMQALVDALPETFDVESGKAEGGGKIASGSSARVSAVRAAVAKGSSLGSNRGVQKKRSAVAKVERDRFAKNWAAMATGKDGQSGATDSNAGEKLLDNMVASDRSARWAALKRHIAQSMESNG